MQPSAAEFCGLRSAAVFCRQREVVSTIDSSHIPHTFSHKPLRISHSAFSACRDRSASCARTSHDKDSQFISSRASKLAVRTHIPRQGFVIGRSKLAIHRAQNLRCVIGYWLSTWAGAPPLLAICGGRHGVWLAWLAWLEVAGSLHKVKFRFCHVTTFVTRNRWWALVLQQKAVDVCAISEPDSEAAASSRSSRRRGVVKDSPTKGGHKVIPYKPDHLKCRTCVRWADGTDVRWGRTLEKLREEADLEL